MIGLSQSSAVNSFAKDGWLASAMSDVTNIETRSFSVKYRRTVDYLVAAVLSTRSAAPPSNVDHSDKYALQACRQ
jgi:hypothetical protein